MATLDDVRTSIWTLLKEEVGDIRYAPEHPTETLPAYPAMVVYTEAVEWHTEVGATVKRAMARVVVEVHVSRGKSLHRSIDELQPFLDSVPNELILGLKDDTYTQRFTFGQIDAEVIATNWGGIDTMAVRFTIQDVKVRNTVS